MSEPTSIRCLSLWQPWASLVAWGEKQIETRSWGTNYRGLVAIHAAKRWTLEEKNCCFDEPFRSVLTKRTVIRQEQYLHDNRLPFGAVIAVATLSDCIKMNQICEKRPRPGYEVLYGSGSFLSVLNLTDKEYAFGNYAPGRFAWMLSDIRALPKPIPFRAMQGLFTLPDDVACQLREAIHAL